MKRIEKFFVIVLVTCMFFVNSVNVFATKTSNTTTTPPAPTLGYSPSAPTNGNVTVTVYYPTGALNKQYKLGTNGVWVTYTAPIVLTSNAYVVARYQNSTGVWSTLGGVTVSNIDKTPPSNPTFSASSDMITNQDVSVTISFSQDSTVKQYKIGDNGIWNGYVAPITLSENNTIYAKASDAVGNWTPVSVYSVTNIDKLPPSTPILTADTDIQTNSGVYVSITYPADAIVKQYKIGANGFWSNYTAPLSIQENTAIYAKAQDLAGNWSGEGALTVSNIDRESPEIPGISVSISELTNQDVVITIGYSADSVIRQYKIGNAELWSEYSTPLTINSNATIYARASDNAGNWTTEASYVVGNIDKSAPDNPFFTASKTSITNQDVTILINYSEDSSTRLYKIGESGGWLDYTVPLVIGSNCEIYAKASDGAGNWTPVIGYSVSNIDKIAPEAPVINASSKASTDQPVALTISYSTDSAVRQYKIGINGNWTAYTGPVVLNSNDTLYASSSDTAGNWSLETNYTVTSITKTVLGYTVKYWSTDVSSYNSMVANTKVLNEIATATYSVDGFGTLTGAAPIDQISYANNNGIRTKLMVSNEFNASIAKQLLDSPANRENLKNNILRLLQTHNYKGVDIDIENIPASCRDNFTTFMSEIYSSLKPLGYEVSVAVQAKTSDSPNAPWTYAFDYKSLAMYSDFLMIMAYDEHYPGGTPGAVASIGWVTNVLDYTLTVVPKEKIVLGLAAYGYDWSSGATQSYSINGCYNLAAQYGSTIYFDNATKSKYFTYVVNGIPHTVWFEDGETIAHKLDLVNSRDIKGIGVWRLGLENPSFWNTIKMKLNK